MLSLLLLHLNLVPALVPLPVQCDGTDLSACRKELWKYVFNTTTGALPSKSEPDFITHPDWEMRGLPGPGQGTGVGNVSWKMGLQKLVWTIGAPGGGMRPGMLRLNSTIWYTRNTTGDAPSNSPPVPLSGVGAGTDAPHCPDAKRPGYLSYTGKGVSGKAGSNTLVIHHNGHSPCSGSEPQRTRQCTDCTPNFDTTQDWLNQLGYDVMEIAMPFHGCNRIPANETCSAKHCVSNVERGFDCQRCKPQGTSGSMYGSHSWFEQFEEMGDEVMRYFLEPVVLAVNYAVNVLKYKHIAMVGLSGGGWTTTIAAAIDSRITLSMPIAGSMPKTRSTFYPQYVPDFPEGSRQGEGGGGDFEQNSWPMQGAEMPGQKTGGRPLYTACGWACLYTLAATPAKPTVDPPRFALQMVHEWDSCCFQAGGFHDNITAYNKFVQAQLTDGRSWFQTSANLGNFHEINYRDKVTMGMMIERLRRKGKGGLKRAHFEDLPFNVILNDWGGEE